MDPGQLISDVFSFADEFVSQISQVSSQVIKDVGYGTATVIHDVANMSEAATMAVTKTGLEFTNGVTDCARDAGRAVGIAPVSDIATDIFKGCGEITAGAVNMGVGLPIGAAKGTAEIISFVAMTSSDAITASGGGVSTVLSLAARPEETAHRAAGFWKQAIQDTGAGLRNAAYDLIVELMKKVSLPNTLLLAIVMVILLLVVISFIVVMSTIIALVEGCRYLSQLPVMRCRFTSRCISAETLIYTVEE
ncbi:hypothetical protein ZTR_06713 [Talaromyces verruculosus]|nr:hypothetical protein ZTR_06713 [Talaromyces verruculosus]